MKEPDLLKNRTIIITGASAGLGKETAYHCVKAGATVILACRNKNKTESAIEEIKNRFDEKDRESIGKRLIFMQLDLSSLTNVYNFAKQYSETEIVTKHCGSFMQTQVSVHEKIKFLAVFMRVLIF